MHHTPVTTSHATHACIANKTYGTTQHTACHEGSMTREGNTWRGDISQERKEGQQWNKMGQVYARHPCHNLSRNPRMHCQLNLLHNRTHLLRQRKHATGEKHMGDITQERKECQQVHKMGQVCARHPCHNPTRNHRMRHPQKLLPHPTHMLRRSKHATGEMRMVGTHDAGENSIRQVHKMGQFCAPHPCLSSSRNPRMHCKQKSYCTTVLTSWDE